MISLKRLLLFAVLCMLSTIAVAKIEIIPLQHQLASNILPTVQQFLPAGATAQAYNDTLIIKAEPATLIEIKQLIQQIDTPLQRIRISLRKTDHFLSDSERFSVSAEVVISNRGAYGGISLENDMQLKNHATVGNYQVQGITGKPVRIAMGSSVAHQQQFLVLRPHGVQAYSQTYYIDVENGFHAVAQSRPNNQVWVDIYSQFQEYILEGNAVRNTTLATEVFGKMGAWLHLGEISTEKNIENYGATRYHSQQQRQQYMYLKVDLLP